MTRIRVNTDDLEAKATDFESAAKAFNTAGDDILAAAMSLPSYEGQLSGPARAAAYEIQRQSRDVHASLSSDAESLRRTAQAFEEVDKQAIDAFTRNSEVLFSAINVALSVKQATDVGNSYLGYRDDDLSDVIIICMYGECRHLKKPLTEDQQKWFNDFKAQVDAYYAARDRRNEHYNNSNKIYVAMLGGVAVNILAAVAAECVLGYEYNQEYNAMKAEEVKMADATEAAAAYYKALFGVEYKRDDHQSAETDYQSVYRDIY
jgi:hypothetical protein